MEHRMWVSKYRDEIKGLAILWVVWFHSPLALPGGLDMLRQLGYGGVDIFFFLMGIGLYQSLRKQESLLAYTTRRLWRILPAYLPVLFLWMAIMYPGYGLSTVQAIRGVAGNLTMTGFWLQTPKVFNWFANGQFLFLLIAPLCYAVLVKSTKPVHALVLLVMIAGTVGLASIGMEQMMGVSRLPIFLLGMAFAMDWNISKRKGLVRGTYWITFAVGLCAVLLCMMRYRELLNDYGMYWYPFVLITPALCVGVAWLLNKAQRWAKVIVPLKWIGQSSFEIYLINIWLVELAKKYAIEDAGWWALLCIGNVALGIGYHRLIAWVTPRLQTSKKSVA